MVQPQRPYSGGMHDRRITHWGRGDLIWRWTQSGLLLIQQSMPYLSNTPIPLICASQSGIRIKPADCCIKITIGPAFLSSTYDLRYTKMIAFYLFRYLNWISCNDKLTGIWPLQLEGGGGILRSAISRIFPSVFWLCQNPSNPLPEIEWGVLVVFHGNSFPCNQNITPMQHACLFAIGTIRPTAHNPARGWMGL